MSQEFTPLQNHQEVWNGALVALRDGRKMYMGYDLKTVPPESTNPEQIHLIQDVDSTYKAGSRTLVLNESGPVSFEVDILSTADSEPEEIKNEYDSDAKETLHRLGRLANRIRDLKAKG